MQVTVGILLAIAGIGAIVLPARFIHAEQRLYAQIVGQAAARTLTRSLFVIMGCGLMLAGVLLSVRAG